MDDRRVGIPHGRHHAGELVGVQRAWLGRLVVLGPGRERLVHAVARRDRADSLAGGDGAARGIPRLDAAPRNLRVLAESARSVPRALRSTGLGARIRHRPGARACSSWPSSCLSSAPRSRSMRGARPVNRRRRQLRCLSRARRSCSPTTCCSSPPRATVLLGTLYPLLLDALDAGKISVGPPYFNSVFVPLMLPLAALLGFGPLSRWKRDEWRRLAGEGASCRSWWSLLVSVGTGARHAGVVGNGRGHRIRAVDCRWRGAGDARPSPAPPGRHPFGGRSVAASPA